MTPPNRFSNHKVLVLLAPGFEEGATIYCLDRIREAGFPAALVSLASGLVNGVHGIAVLPDCSLDQITDHMTGDTNYRLIIVPGGKQCTTALFADPRTHLLLRTTLQKNGLVAAMTTAEPSLSQVGISSNTAQSQFVPQGDKPVADFTEDLINLLWV